MCGPLRTADGEGVDDTRLDCVQETRAEEAGCRRGCTEKGERRQRGEGEGREGRMRGGKSQRRRVMKCRESATLSQLVNTVSIGPINKSTTE